MSAIGGQSKASLFYTAASNSKQVKLDALVTDDPKECKNIPDKRVGVWRNIVNLGMSYTPGVAICFPEDPNTVVIIPWPKEEELILVSSVKNALGHETVSFTIRRNNKRFTYIFR